MLTFILALCVMVCLFTLPIDAPGEGGYATIALVMLGGYTFSTLSFISLFAAAVSAFAIRPARWFLIPTRCSQCSGVWFLTHAEVKATVDTVGSNDIPRLIGSLKTHQDRDWDRDVFLLAHLGTEASPSLVQAIQSDDPNIRLARHRHCEICCSGPNRSSCNLRRRCVTRTRKFGQWWQSSRNGLSRC